MFMLPDIGNKQVETRKILTLFNDNALGKFGDMIIDMLPNDLVFTVFVPSQQAFARDLRLFVNDSFSDEKVNDTNAIVSRILGFSAVPRGISPDCLRVGEEVSYDSLSGLVLYIVKDIDGMLVVNNKIRSKKVDLRKGEIVVHVMDGVIMDPEFEQSVLPDDSEDG
ncbi:hypothetical protein ACFE04_007908 [Oxalis oulophora]